MSHVTHINNYKKSLISLGIVEPETQISLTRTAYILGLIRAMQAKGMDKEIRNQFLPRMLSHWNEIYPVDSAKIILGVNAFYNQLQTELTEVKGKIFIHIGESEDTRANPNYDDPETFATLVKVITAEAISKYEKMEGL